ncbi:hypothetical protein AQJ23_43340 [Streptomyces antibioticus]|nr:hypothetical protein AQJ23_43340 [Streptomyces antibioticus]
MHGLFGEKGQDRDPYVTTTHAGPPPASFMAVVVMPSTLVVAAVAVVVTAVTVHNDLLRAQAVTMYRDCSAGLERRPCCKKPSVESHEMKQSVDVFGAVQVSE